MRRTALLSVLAATTTAVVLVGAADPASAAISTSVAATTLTVTLTGNEEISFSCVAGSIAINESVPSPTLPCTTVTQVTVSGDGGQQVVQGRSLNAAAFTANPRLNANVGANVDYVSETDQNDSIALGSGTDTLEVDAVGTSNTALNLGDDGDFLIVNGTPGNDNIILSSGGTSLTTSTQTTSGTYGRTVTNSEVVTVRTGGGNDSANSSGVLDASSIDSIDLDGGIGNDTLASGPVPTLFYGRSGTNAMIGGNDNDSFYSASETDAIDTGGGFDYLTDAGSLRTGGRTINGSADLVWSHETGPGDAVLRIREAPPGVAATASLGRPGRQVLPDELVSINARKGSPSTPKGRNLWDVHALTENRNVNVTGDGDEDLLDVTVPVGSWIVNGNPSDEGVVLTTDGSLGNVAVTDIDLLSVHGPWTNKNRGWTHRVTRDLVFRFPTPTTLDEAQALLGNGTITRPQATNTLMDTDEYRGLDVDRTFKEYLRRSADAGGRTYWINSIENGKALWRFRAQLFGSNEYFTKAGGTNGTYVVKAYDDVLGRAPDPGGLAYWTNKLNNGADRGSVALQFINSPESRRRLVDDQFLRFLNRLPTTNEQTTWVAKIPGATGEQDLIAFLANSGEYYNLS